jgi:protoporphyrinogen oxidase
MGQLIERLMETLDRRGATCEWNRPVTVLDPGRPTVLAVPAPAAASLLSKHAPQLAEAIAQVRMTSLLTVTAFFDPHPHDLRGFGVLFPRSEGVNALGVLFNNEVFPGRSTLRSETWIYGSAFSGPLPPDVEILDAVVRDRAKLTGQRAVPTASYPTRWPDALPVYEAAVLDVARQRAELPPWLGVSGNYFGRLGATHLLELAEATAARLARYCRS